MTWHHYFYILQRSAFFCHLFVLFAGKALQEYKPDTLIGVNELPFNLSISKCTVGPDTSNRCPYICRYVRILLEGTSSQGAVWGHSSIKRWCPLRGRNPDLIGHTASRSSSTLHKPMPRWAPKITSAVSQFGAAPCWLWEQPRVWETGLWHLPSNGLPCFCNSRLLSWDFMVLWSDEGLIFGEGCLFFPLLRKHTHYHLPPPALKVYLHLSLCFLRGELL